MKKLLPILLILFALIGNGQALVYPANYTLGNYCFQGNGTSNYIVLSPYAGNFDGYSNGVIEFDYIGVSSGNGECIWCLSDNSPSDYSVIYIAGSVTNSLSLYVQNAGGAFDFICHLTLGQNFLRDGLKHNVKIIVDGTNNRFEIDGTIYDDAGGNLDFYIGSKTSDFFTNITGANTCVLHARDIGAVALYGLGQLFNFKISDGSGNLLADYPMTEAPYDFPTFYDVSGNGNHATGYGTNYRTTCTNNNYNETNGMTYVKYGSQKVRVPYLLSGNSQYSAVAPVINAAEKTNEFPSSWWDSQKAVSNLGKIAVQ